jgi:hypothetical protein
VKYQGKTPFKHTLYKMKDRKIKQVLSGGGYEWEGEGKWRE